MKKDSYGADYYAQPGDAYLKVAEAKMARLAAVFREKCGISSALDIGCAHGVLVRCLRNLGVEAYGVDVSDAAFDMASPETRPYLNIADIENDRLPFKEGTFEAVIALEVFEHLKDLSATLEQLRRVLKSEGYLYITTPLPVIDSKPGQFVIGRGWHRLDETHINVHGRGYWKRLMADYGFSYLGLFPEVLASTPSEFWPMRYISRLPGGSRLRAVISGAYLFRRMKCSV
ncbi:class I SAM-dependent methyltransferase [Chloroflexota bacterium]